MKFHTTLTLIGLLSVGIAAADEQQSAQKPAINLTFADHSFGKPWHVNTGEWKVKDGVLHGKELKADRHSAALRYPIETRNATYELRFQFSDGLQGFHFGFDPKRGSLNKKGHLFSIVISPKSWKIMKHVDKNRPKEDPNENLAQAATPFEAGKWYTLRVTTSGTSVVASIDGKKSLKASHPTFSVPKPTLVFRCIGDGVQLDDIKVWHLKSDQS